MKINVTKDNVSIETKIENHYGEYNVNECLFVFDEYFNDVTIKRAVFSSQKDNKSFEVDIINNKCFIPHQVLNNVYDEITLGVYGYDISGDELLIRYSPTPDVFVVHEGSYRENAEKPEIITPSQYDMYSQALQEGLAEVDGRLDNVEKQGGYASEQGNYAKEQGDYAKEQGTNAKNVADDTQKKAEEGKFNGKSLEFVWQGTKLGVRLEGQEEYQFVDLQGVQGEIGATGEPFKIKKTYASVSEMNADFRNMVFGDYVMIASSVDVEDNAKLYTRGESAWIFISDFSGAMGIRGETGLTPNIKIGEVKTLEAGSQAKVTRSGSNEEPVFNFEIPKGDKGDDYVLTEEDKVEIGEKVNTEYEKRIEENEKDIVDIESYLDNLTPKASAKGELVHINDALPLATFENKVDGNVEQETTKGTNLLNFNVNQVLDVTYNDDGTITLNGKGNDNLWYSPIKFKANKKYYIKVELVSGEITGVDNSGIMNPSATVFLPLNKFNEFSFTEDTIEQTMWTHANVVYNNARLKIWVSEEQTDFEKFTNGASPSPEFPQEIEVIEGYNLAKLTKGKVPSVNNGAPVDNAAGGMSDFIEVDINKTYNLIYVGTINQIYLFAYDEKKNFLGYLVGDNIKNTSMLFSKHPTTKYVVVRIDLPGSGHELPKVQFARDLGISTIIPYGCVGVKNHGKNELDLSKISTVTNSGIEISYNEQTKKVRFKGTATNTYPSSDRFSMFIPKGTYTFSSVGNSNAFIWLRDANGTLISIFNNKNNKTITLSRDAFIMQVGIEDLVVGNTYDLEIGYQLEKGSVATEIEPYQEQIVPLDLKGNWVGKINDDIKDYLVTDKKKYWLVKNVGKVVLDGSEHWFKSGNSSDETFVGATVITDIIKTKNDFVLSDSFITKPSGVFVTGGCRLYNYNTDGTIANLALGLDATEITDIDKFKQRISEIKPVFYYQTAETEIIELGELPEPIKTFEGTNNIQVLANLDTELEVKYALDLKKYYDNKIAELSSQII